MDKIMTAIGFSAAVILLYQLAMMYKKNKNISKNNLMLGIVTSVLCVIIIDGLTTKWLICYLGKIYYCRFVGGVIDAILIIIMFRKPKEGLSRKDILVARFQGICCIVFFSWYLMYYLCM